MALIRKAQASSLIRDAVVLDLGDLQRQGQAIIDKARERAAQIEKKAQAEAQQLLETTSKKGFVQGEARGYKEGLDKGREEGLVESRDAMVDSIQRIETGWVEALKKFNTVRSVINQEARVDVLRLAVMIGEQITYRSIEADPAIVEDQIAEALRMLSRRTSVVIRVNPGDLEIAQGVLPGLVEQIENCVDASLIPDDTISPGGCVLSNGRHGEIDASIEAQIERIVDELIPSATDAILPDPPGVRAPDETDQQAQSQAQSQAQLQAESEAAPEIESQSDAPESPEPGEAGP